MTQDSNIGEQSLSKLAELAISSQLDQADELKVEIKTDLLKLIQGKLDSVVMTGEGVVMQQDLRAEAVNIQTGAVAIDPLKLVMGTFEFKEAVDANAQVLLTEGNLNRVLSSDFLRSKMTGLKIKLQGELRLVQIQQVAVRLPEAGKMLLEVEMLLPDTQELKQFSAVAVPSLADQGQRIAIEILSAECQGISLDFATALFEEIVALLDLRNLDMGGFSMQLKDLDVQVGQLLLRGQAVMEQGALQQS